MPFWVKALTFAAFACAGYLATQFARYATRTWPRYRDLPIVREPSLAMTLALSLVTGWIGASYAAQGSNPYALGLIGVVCLTLDFACTCDVLVGRLPLAVTLPAIGIIIASAVLASDTPALVACAVVTAPFLVAAAISKSSKIGWSEVQLVALGALVLNVTLGLLAFAIACFAAVGIALARGTVKQPVALAPYLAFAIELSLLTPNAIR
jgi:hypothetical protein